MTTVVDPRALFQRLAEGLPQDLWRHLFVTGSLAAAHHYREQLPSGGVRTKDADLVIHPAGNTTSAAEITRRLLDLGWRCKEECVPHERPEPAESLRAIRLVPPDHTDYFIELLNVPRKDAGQGVQWIGFEVEDGWYGLPSFEFLGLAAFHRQTSDSGLEYSAPSMMALANSLSHPSLGALRMSTPIANRRILRSAKDLGRVVALAWLAGRPRTAAWATGWQEALQSEFPDRWQVLAKQAGSGLMELLADGAAFEEAWFTCDTGLLSGKNVSLEQLRVTAERLLLDVIEPLEAAAE